MKILTVWILPMFALGILSSPSNGLSDLSKAMISGCNQAEDGQFPYQVAITLNNKFLCSGSIIAPDYVLTSAYCIDCATPTDLLVQVGSTDLNEMEIKRVQNIIKHERYDRWSRTSDIALLKLKNTLDLNNETVQAIPLDKEDNKDKEDHKDNKDHKDKVDTIEAEYAGWSKNSRVSERLSFSNITIDSNEDCRKALWSKLKEGQLCSIFEYGQGGCTDKGSPLVSNGKLVGIHSYVCSTRQVVHVYTKVSSYYDWIIKHTGIEERQVTEEPRVTEEPEVPPEDVVIPEPEDHEKPQVPEKPHVPQKPPREQHKE